MNKRSKNKSKVRKKVVLQSRTLRKKIFKPKKKTSSQEAKAPKKKKKGKSFKESQWKPGQSGNPDKKNMTGRPPLPSLTSMLSDMLSEPSNKKPDILKAEEIVMALLKRGRKGDTKALAMIFDRHDGKVVQKIRASVLQGKLGEMTDEDLDKIIQSENTNP